MKKNYKKTALLGVTFSVLSSAMAQQAVLDINQVSTNVLPSNSLFWDQQQFANYEVPKGSGKHSLYLGNLWFIGKNTVSENLHGFAERYGSLGPETWTGPLKIDGSATTTMSTVLDFGRVWKLNRSDIDALVQAQSNGALAAGTYTPPTDILQWPGNGPAGYAQKLSPFFDNNSDGIYNIYDGDYPIMKGEQMLYWILNDNYGVHAETNLQSMGVEIHISLYACKKLGASPQQDFINYTTFLEYEIINRSTQTFKDVYAGFNSDLDLGYAHDDYVGSHVDADAFYVYNGDLIDAQGNVPAPDQYGYNWPVQSIQFLEGKENQGRTMSSFMYYVNQSSPMGDPDPGSGQHYYNYLRSYFKNGAHMVFGGNGFPGAQGALTVEAKYMYPGSSDPAHQGTNSLNPGFEWSQPYPCPTCPPTNASDVRGIGATGPFELAPNGSVKVVLGLITTFDSTTTIDERVQLNRDQNKILRQWYDGNAWPCEMGQLSTDEFALEALSVYPNPTDHLLRISGESLSAGTDYTVLDINGRVMLLGKSQQDTYIELNVENLSSGLYFVQLKNKDGRVLTLKFMRN